MGTLAHSLFGVALGKPQFLQTVKDEAAYGEVYVGILHTGACHLEGMVVGCLYDRVYLQLALAELAVHGVGAGVVRAVVVDGLGTGITEHEASAFQLSHRGVAVHNLAVLREDGGEADHGAIRVSDAVHLTADILLGQARTSQSHGGGVHLIAYHRGALQFFYLLLFLGRTHLHHSLDQLHGCRFLLLVGMYAYQVKQLQLDVISVGRQEVDGALLAQCSVADGLEFFHRSPVLHAHLCSHVGHSVYRAIPHDVLYVYVVAYQRFLVFVQVYHAHQAVALLTEIV